MANNKGYWLIYDSYPETNENIIQQNMKEFNIPYEKARMLKKLAWDFGFEFVKRYHIQKNLTPKQVSIIQKIIALYYKIIAILKTEI